MKLSRHPQVQKVAGHDLSHDSDGYRHVGRREPSLQLVDQPIEQQVSGAAEDPPDPLLRNWMDVSLQVTPAQGLKVDDGKEKKIVVRQDKEIAEKIFEAGRAGLVLDVVKVNDHPEHEHRAQDRPEICRNREATGSSAIHANSEDGYQQQDPPTKFKPTADDAKYQQSGGDQQAGNCRAQ